MPIAKLGKYRIHYRNSEEYHHLKQEIFTHDAYYFETRTLSPIIIDAGAHIGLATLYFKKLYPAARITALEPLPQNQELLEKNIWDNNLEDVTVIPAALANHMGEAVVYFDQTADNWFSTAGFLPHAWNNQQLKTQAITVNTITLTSLLDQPIDLLKLDIEGAEHTVLAAAATKLHLIAKMLIEFHPTAAQSLPALLEVLTDNNFSTTLWQGGQETTPARAKGLVLIEATNQRNSK